MQEVIYFKVFLQPFSDHSIVQLVDAGSESNAPVVTWVGAVSIFVQTYHYTWGG
jgi:hypothetical protein